MSRFFSRPLLIAAVAATVFAAPAQAAETAIAFKSPGWSFDGPFGTFDRAALQRGFQVYKEVCAACHGLKRVAIRSLGEPGGPGFTEAEVKALANQYMLPAPPNDQGQTVDANGAPLMRAAIPADAFPSPFANDNAARFANNGSLPPDLSLITKARLGGADYLYSLLTGYEQAPAGVTVPAGRYYNAYFTGHQVSMPPPLTPDRVTYADGTAASIDQMAHDVTTFLSWAAEPKMEERKHMGLIWMISLLVLAVLLFFSYRKIWHGEH